MPQPTHAACHDHPFTCTILQEHAPRTMHSLLGLLTDGGMPCDVLIRDQLIMGQPAGGHTSFVVQSVGCVYVDM
jgi:hypothetical protein